MTWWSVRTFVALLLLPWFSLTEASHSRTPVSPSNTTYKPIFTGLTPQDGQCAEIQIGFAYTATVQVTHVNHSQQIVEFTTSSPSGMYFLPLNTNGLLYSSSITWSPNQHQAGKHVFCFKAVDSSGMESETRCVTILVGLNNTPNVILESRIPITPISRSGPGVEWWSIKFDHPIKKPRSASYIRLVLSSTGQLVYKVNALSSHVSISYNQTVLYFTMPFAALSMTGSYAILIDPGAVVGLGCSYDGPPTPGVASTSQWGFYVAGICNPGYYLAPPAFNSCIDVNECGAHPRSKRSNGWPPPVPSSSISPTSTYSEATSVYPSLTLSPPVPSECQSYMELTNQNRYVTYIASNGNVYCDSSITSGWYRFTGAAGTQMPDSCTHVPESGCGTYASGWLNGSHPDVADGAVTYQVCYHFSSNCCWQSNDIQVRNCSGFYVYNLVPSQNCYYRYCGMYGNESIARLTSSSDYSIRLVNGASINEGRVEILLNGAWGTICDDSWDIQDANVVCRMLNYSGATSEVSRAGYGSGSGMIWLDNVACQGNEFSITDCAHNGIGSHDCGHHEDAGVVCATQQQQTSTITPTTASSLSPPSSSSSSVPSECQSYMELTNQNRHVAYIASNGDVHCDSSITSGWYRFTGAAGTQMPDSCTHVPESGCGTYASGWLNGSHPDVADGAVTYQVCYHFSSNCCWQSNDIQVRNCSGFYVYNLVPSQNCYYRYCGMYGNESIAQSTSSSDYSIRLVNGASINEGRVEILLNGAWGTICDDSWDINGANVVCRMLNYSGATSEVSRAGYGSGSGMIWLDNVVCQGNEVSITDCAHNGIGSHDCGHHEDAGVVCATHQQQNSTITPTTSSSFSLPSSSSSSVPLECQSYMELSNRNRHVAYIASNGDVHCDSSITSGWYRFTGAAGTQMPDSCTHIPESGCGTYASGWLNGSHPDVADGAVTYQVCYHFSSNCCWQSNDIQVRNCSGFYVYNLVPSQNCYYRYCGMYGNESIAQSTSSSAIAPITSSSFSLLSASLSATAAITSSSFSLPSSSPSAITPSASPSLSQPSSSSPSAIAPSASPFLSQLSSYSPSAIASSTSSSLSPPSSYSPSAITPSTLSSLSPPSSSSPSATAPSASSSLSPPSSSSPSAIAPSTASSLSLPSSFSLSAIALSASSSLSPPSSPSPSDYSIRLVNGAGINESRVLGIHPTLSSNFYASSSINVQPPPEDFVLHLPADCAQVCSNTPGSFVCSCYNGFQLGSDGKTCLDIDECRISNGGYRCSHHCVNVPGSFYCECPEGLTMAADNRSCVEPEVTVTCSDNNMTVYLEKQSFRFIDASLLHLRDPLCQAYDNGTHFILTTALNSCGTTHNASQDALVFWNDVVVNAVNIENGLGITQSHNIGSSFYCQYSRQKLVSLSFTPLWRLPVTEPGYGDLTLELEVYKSSSFDVPYNQSEFPMEKNLGDHLYLMFSVVSSADLVVMVTNITATKDLSPYSNPQYSIIENGCPRDSTMDYRYDETSSRQQLTMQVFRFLHDYDTVYIHVEMVACHAGSANSRCAHSCLINGARKRREASQESTEKAWISGGPLIIKDVAKESGDSGSGANGRQEALSGGMGAVGALLVLGVVALVVLAVNCKNHIARMFINRIKRNKVGDLYTLQDEKMSRRNAFVEPEDMMDKRDAL